MTTTPRTDAEARKIWSEGNYGMGDDYVEEVVDADFARGLEEEIAKLESAAREWENPANDKLWHRAGSAGRNTENL